MNRFSKKRIYEIRIGQSCSEDWNAMSPASNGRFCDKCQHVVTGLTNLSDAQIVKLLSASEGKICGRAFNKQLNRDLVQTSENVSGNYPAIIATSLLLASSTPVAAQQNIPVESSVQQTISSSSESQSVEKTGNDTLVLCGFLVDSVSSEPLIEGIIRLNGNLVALADFDGKFQFTIPDSLAGEPGFMIYASFPGFWNKEFYVSRDELQNELLIQLQRSEDYLESIGMGIVIVKKKKWRPFRKRH